MILDFGYVIGGIAGFIGGIGLIAFNSFGNKSETKNGRRLGMLVGVILIASCFQQEVIPFLAEALYLVAGIYLVREHHASYESEKIRVVLASVGYLVLLVPLKPLINVLLLWRAVA